MEHSGTKKTKNSSDKGKNKAPVKRKRRSAAVLVASALLVLALVCALVIGRELEKRSYKLNYPKTISQYAQEFDLDPYLVAAMIHCESGNRPEAVSPDGALGLMQVMPQTGEWIASKLGVENFRANMLLEPSVNIRFGCWYLRFLLDRYDEDRQLAVAAYNAGHGKVDQWKDDPDVSTKGQLVNIPYPETKNYVEKVQRAYEKYESLYKNAF